MTTMKARDIVGSKLSRSNSNRMLVKEAYDLNLKYYPKRDLECLTAEKVI